MTSSRERQQRAAARARLAQQMAERQEAARKRRMQRLVTGGAAVAVVVVLGVVWAVVAAVGDDEPDTSAVSDDSSPAEQPASPGATDAPAANEPVSDPEDCEWLSPEPPYDEQLTDVGTPEPVEPPGDGAVMTIATDQGDLAVDVAAADIPCTYASFAHLAEQDFYDDTSCHRLTTEGAGISVLQCGDPSGTGMGGPMYKLHEENLPTEEQEAGEITYPAGTLAMAKTNQPSTTGSQFFLVYEDTELPPDYTVVGTITEGMDIVEGVAADGAVDPETGESAPDGEPATELVIEDLRVEAA